MDRVKICHILPYFFELDANFFHTTRQISPQADLAFNVRFELQVSYAAPLDKEETHGTAPGKLDAVYWSSNCRNFHLTDFGKFRLRACKNLTEFDKI